MANRIPTSAGSRINGRLWYGGLAALLLAMLLFPWTDGLTPAVTPLRFLQHLPFPAGNVLFACYLVAIYLNIRMAVIWEPDIRLIWYRYALTLGAMVAILFISGDASMTLTWAAVVAWAVLAISAYGELHFLQSK